MSNDIPRIKYDVFVSFRGSDIRLGFLSHLSKAFHQKQIHAFVDDKLQRGDEISQSLLEAIEGSSISLIIFSEDYASSRWCLEELVKIVECREEYGHCNTDPTNVRHQKGSFETALAEHEKKYDLPIVRMWRRALKNSANLSGINSTNFRNEAELLEDIIDHVLKRLNKKPINNSKGLIGIDKPIADLESLLRQESKDVRVIGIWGMHGIGKTTIVEELFNKQCFEYESCCFLAKVNEELERHGVICVKEKLLSTLLTEDVKIKTTNGLPNDILRRIGRVKIFIVLDDVNDYDQVEKLVGTLNWLGSGSRIIITARDRQILHNKVNDIYEIGSLSIDEAGELFYLNAFNQSHVGEEYWDYLLLSYWMVDYAKGVPLVLKVLGQLLRGKDKEAWKSQLDKLQKMPNKKVHDKMKPSYYDLDRKEKNIFLDIACFFNGLNLKVDYLNLLLRDHENDNSVAIGLERLKDKSLITISEDNTVSMHHIVQEMGREIAHEESSEDLGSRSRLLDADEIYEVLNNNKGTSAIRSISIDLSKIRKLKLGPGIFSKMSNLQFLDFHGKYIRDDMDFLPEGLEYLPSNIRYLRWKQCPLRSLPEKFSAKDLVILDLSDSCVQKLWDGMQNLVNLKEVRLYRCQFMEELPDFTKATNLEVLNLSHCGLSSVHSSIFSLKKLEKLEITYCFNLTRLTSDHIHLSSLRYLNLELCHGLKELLVTSENMIELNMRGSFGLKVLPSSFGRQSKLEILVIYFSTIQSLPSSIKDCTRLRCLDLRHCDFLQTIPELPPSLETLLANECRYLRTVLFPSTAVKQLKENRKKIEFWNCLCLDKHSLRAIELNVQINVMKFACQHFPAPELDFDDYNDYLGFIFCFIVPKDSKRDDKLILYITISVCEGEGEKGSTKMYMNKSDSTKSDHVCVMYDKRCSHYLNSMAKNMKRFKINVTAKTGPISFSCEEEEVLKGFGVSLINTSTYHNFIQQMEFFD
ncbi:hypothetical protein JHK85_006508 [Glycine max]|nr:hypothetical protein JHK85_006508 [Glycine max]